MTATHITSGPRRPHRLELIEQRNGYGIFNDLDSEGNTGRIKCPMTLAFVTPTYETLKEWRKENGSV